MEPWTHARVFRLLGDLDRLRVISVCGPSVFESLCTFGPHGFAQGHMNAITPAYHWHVDLARFGHVRSGDRIYERSQRRVLFLELCEKRGDEPFLRIFVYRDKDTEFDPGVEKAFAEAHTELGEGVDLASEAP